MNYEPLPAMLKVGDKVACPKHYDPPAVYEVFKVDDFASGRIYLMNEAGVTLHGNLNVELLKSYDYEIIANNS